MAAFRAHARNLEALRAPLSRYEGNEIMKVKFAASIDILRRDTSGATAVEYGLIVPGVALVIIGAIALSGGSLSNIFNSVAAGL
jgi:Flp pilus assembly pilin Flp